MNIFAEMFLQFKGKQPCRSVIYKAVFILFYVFFDYRGFLQLDFYLLFYNRMLKNVPSVSAYQCIFH